METIKPLYNAARYNMNMDIGLGFTFNVIRFGWLTRRKLVWTPTSVITFLEISLDSTEIPNSAPDNVCTAINYGSGCSKYGLIVKRASIQYGCSSVGMVILNAVCCETKRKAF